MPPGLSFYKALYQPLRETSWNCPGSLQQHLGSSNPGSKLLIAAAQQAAAMFESMQTVSLVGPMQLSTLLSHVLQHA